MRIICSRSHRSVRRAYWLGSLLQEMSAQQIPVIVLKGAYLGEIVYGDPAQRPMGDIDLLVRQEHLQAAVEVLRRQGYQTAREFWLEVELRGGHQLPSFQKAEAASLELHWRLQDLESPHPVDMDRLWRRACPVTISGQPALGLGPEDLILYLCLHAAGHHLEYRLRAVYDIALTAAHFGEELDWTKFCGLAREWDAERAAFLLLWLASELLRAPVPASLISALRPDDFSSEQAGLALQLVFDDPGGEVEVPYHLFKLLHARGIAARIRLILGQLFLPPGVMSQMYGVAPGSWKVLRCYPVRWWSLLNRGLGPLRAMMGMEREARRQVEAEIDRLRLQEQLAAWLEGKRPYRSE